MRPRGSRGAIAFICLLLVAGCTSAPPTLSPSPSASAADPTWPSDTSYGRLFAQVQPGGVVSKDVALQAFATAIAPLPGVPDAPGAAPADFERADGTFAINWLRPYLDQLTPEQKAAVDAALTPTPSSRIVEPRRPIAERGLGVEGPLVAADESAQVYTDAIAFAQSEITKRLGRPLKAKIGFGFAPTVSGRIKDAFAYAFPAGTPAKPLCEVRAAPLIVGVEELRINIDMAHEVFHCFQFEVWPPGSASDWIIEGQAEWVGEDIYGPGPDGLLWWEIYVDTPNYSLLTRTYDAVGFYEHLLETSVNPWTVFDAMLKSPSDDVAGFRAAHADSDAFLDSWASSYRRTDPTPTAWFAHGRWATAEHTDPNRLHIANGASKPIESKAFANTLYKVETTADITEVSNDGYVRLLTGATEFPDTGGMVDLCTKGSAADSCDCPEGFTYSGPVLYPGEPTVWLGVTGGLHGASGTVVGKALDDYCQPTPSSHPSPDPRGGPDPCAKGCGQSVGDPHMHTIDQKEYDFQAAGEFVLLRSTDGSIEIQGRQVPYPDVADASITTALAWRVAGHRVAMYEQGAVSGYTLTLDGNQLDPLTVGTMDLGGGTALTALASGVEVAYADGTITQAIFHGNGFAHALDILVAPSDTFRAQASGLLGPLAAGSELPALPDGTALPLSEDRATRFTQRYQQLAAAWHVTDQTSLFDYQPGETTATFDVPDFPTPNVAFTVDELEQQQGVVEFQKASEQCAAVGGDPQTVLHCVFDIMATKDPAYAEFYALVQEYLASGPAALDGGPAVEITPPPPPTPSTGLPAGFALVASDVSQTKGSTIGPDGMLYVSLLKSDFTAQLVSLDTTSGDPGPSLSTTGAGAVFLLDGSLWAAQDDLTGSGNCTLERLDPQTLASQVKIPIGCDIAGPQAVPVADGVWWLDRSTSDADGHGGMIRHIDPATNAVDRSVELPFVNGFLSSSSTTVIFGDSGTDKGWFRLLPGATSFVPLPVTDVGFGLHPQGEGVWLQHVGGVQAEHVTGSATPDRVIPIEGFLAGADDQAIYVQSASSAPATLLRYPLDGSAPTVLLTGAALTTSNGSQDLGYFDNDPLVIGPQVIAKMWLVRDWPTDGASSLIAQAAPIASQK